MQLKMTAVMPRHLRETDGDGAVQRQTARGTNMGRPVSMGARAVNKAGRPPQRAVPGGQSR